MLRGDDVLLPCDQRSNLARAVWLLNGSEVPGTGQERLRVGVDGLLVTNTLPGHSGEYRCYGEERGLRTLLAAYSLTVLPQLPRAATTTTSGPIAASQASGDTKVVYVSAIVVLVVLCAVLGTVLLYVSCLEKRRGKYVLGEPRAVSPELQTVSASCLRKARGEEDEEDDEAYDTMVEEQYGQMYIKSSGGYSGKECALSFGFPLSTRFCSVLPQWAGGDCWAGGSVASLVCRGPGAGTSRGQWPPPSVAQCSWPCPLVPWVTLRAL